VCDPVDGAESAGAQDFADSILPPGDGASHEGPELQP
jgi:hypothetical protein